MTKRLARCAGLLSMMALGALPAPLVADDAFPNRPGKKTVERVCGTCHGLQIMGKLRKTRAGWQASIDDMVTKGMEAAEQDLQEVVSYLAKYLSRLNVNKASAAELADVLDLPAEQAGALVDYRTKIGGFKDFDSLLKTPGIDGKLVAKQRDRITFGDS